MSKTAKGILAAIIAIAAIVFLTRELETERQADGGPDAESLDGAAAVRNDADPGGASATGAGSNIAPGEATSGEEADPHKHIPDPETLYIPLPIEPAPGGEAARQDGAGPDGSEQAGRGAPSAASGVPGGPIPAVDAGQGPVAIDDAGSAPESGAPRIVGTGPGGEQSGIEDIVPVELGPEYDPTVTEGGEVDLGPAPEATDPGNMGPAPEDSGGQ